MFNFDINLIKVLAKRGLMKKIYQSISLTNFRIVQSKELLFLFCLFNTSFSEAGYFVPNIHWHQTELNYTGAATALSERNQINVLYSKSFFNKEGDKDRTTKILMPSYFAHSDLGSLETFVALLGYGENDDIDYELFGLNAGKKFNGLNVGGQLIHYSDADYNLNGSASFELGSGFIIGAAINREYHAEPNGAMYDYRLGIGKIAQNYNAEAVLILTPEDELKYDDGDRSVSQDKSQELILRSTIGMDLFQINPVITIASSEDEDEDFGDSKTLSTRLKVNGEYKISDALFIGLMIGSYAEKEDAEEEDEDEETKSNTLGGSFRYKHGVNQIYLTYESTNQTNSYYFGEWDVDQKTTDEVTSIVFTKFF
jgi:hypothetical protein